jgi:hypothetical protein
MGEKGDSVVESRDSKIKRNQDRMRERNLHHQVLRPLLAYCTAPNDR